ncbi:hypothetical protein ABMY26_01445 [Azospirillum sp. HJ39]|uniref:hypothetical protein n=1 Tax=Azospirillum sp. HJ39 TaxID=3159496 RepID=UPI0035580371
MDDFTPYRRPEVKGAILHRDALWLATLGGLFRWRDDRLEPVPGFAGRPVRALAAAPDGVLLATGDRGAPLLVCDESGAILRRLPDLPVPEAKSLLVQDGVVFAGGKTGLWRLDGEHWTAVRSGRPYEVIGLAGEPGRILAFVKKQGPGSEPALAVSTDGGDRWRHVYEGSYADLARAVAGDLIVTQWGGPHRLGDAVVPRKEPVTAAATGAGTVALIGGSKLELLHGGRCHMEMKHPAFAEAEILLLLGDRALVAGVQGALLVDLSTGLFRDLFDGAAADPSSAKIKKLFALDGGRLLATASFGTFLSEDSGPGVWHPVHADWNVLDAVGVARAPDGVWWLAAQRGLFQSPDNGASWKHVKVTGRPHGFAELTGIAFAGGRLALATKAGLFLSGSGGPKDLRALPAFGRQLIDGLAVDGEGRLIVASERVLHRIDPLDGTAERLADLPPGTEPVATADGRIWLAGKAGLFRLDGGMPVLVETVAGPGELHASAGDGGLLAWRGDRAWLAAPGAAPGAGDWRDVPDWPPGVKSAVPAAGSVIATDRQAIHRRPVA